MPIPKDYVERVYAGVLGKMIGVYLGRPFEGWPYEFIIAKLGEITYYVHEKLGRPLIVTDDDLTGTFTFLRALPDYGCPRDLTLAQIGQTWLNYIIEGRAILWWGGMGNSTEHTAYLRLKSGIVPPQSGSISLNSKIVAEQIGAQIFIDGWAMVSPGDPERAAELARQAASVSHDGEAIYAAQVIAAMEAQAFVERDVNRLIDTALSFIPKDSVIYRVIDQVRERHARERDWRKAREWLDKHYGYHRYGGNCHVVPNHGLIILSLLYGEDDFQKSLLIVNTSGWDTDCNSGNVGCLLGIKNGLAGLETGPDWRGPVADRLYLPTADGGRAITDAVTETYHIVNIGRALAGEKPVRPKGGARFHFELPGAVQGFQPESSAGFCASVEVENVASHSQRGQRSLAIRYRAIALGQAARIFTPTFIPPETLHQQMGYELLASPTLYPGQKVQAGISADEQNLGKVTCRLYIRTYGADDELVITYGPEALLEPGEYHQLEWWVGDTGGAPIAQIGIELSAVQRANGTIYLDYLTWDGAPDVVLCRPMCGGTMWRRAWVNGVDQYEPHWRDAYRIVQNHGIGLLIQGTREWVDYRVTSAITLHLVKSGGIAVRVQGMRRYYALLLRNGGRVRLIRVLDGEEVLAERDFPWEYGETHEFSLQVVGLHLEAGIDGQFLFGVDDPDSPLCSGAIALVCEEGCMSCDTVVIRPAIVDNPLGCKS